MPRNLMTIHDLTEYLSVSESWVRDQIKKRKIPHLKVSGSIRFRPEAIDRWVDEQAREPAA